MAAMARLSAALLMATFVGGAASADESTCDPSVWRWTASRVIEAQQDVSRSPSYPHAIGPRRAGVRPLSSAGGPPR